jgi:hypothetical protein
MIATLRKERHQLWKHIEKPRPKILIYQEEATPEPSNGIWQTRLTFLPLKRYDPPAYHRHGLHPEVFEPISARFS